MSTAEWTLEVALDAAVDCIERHLPGYLAARLAEDALRARPLLNGHLPMPKVVTTGMIDDLAADWVTPAIFLNANSTSYQNYNASSLLDSQPRITATVLLAEGDVNTSEQRIYSNALSMYSDGVRFILSTIFPQDGGCEVGVNAATPDSVQYSPVVRPDGYSVWLRWSEVSVVWTQRVNNYWQTGPPTPPPFDPSMLDPLVWLDPRDTSTMYLDSDGTTRISGNGDPVGRWANKGLAGGIGDAIQTVSASRPVYADERLSGGVLNIAALSSMLAPRSFAVWGTSTAANAGYAGWSRTSGSATLGSVMRRASDMRLSVLNGTGPSLICDIPSRAGVFTESADGRLSLHTQAASDQVTGPPRGSMGTAFFAGHLSATIGHVFVFGRELTPDESKALAEWMEVN